MGQSSRDSGVSLDSFFDRCKLPPGARDECDSFAMSLYSEDVRPVPFQGYCSYTLCAGPDTIIQFRPDAHALDVDIAAAAYNIFGALAPRTCLLAELPDIGLRAYSMSRIQGVSVLDLRAQRCPLAEKTAHRERVVKDFARFQARSWRFSKPINEIETKRLVGSSLRWRLGIMEPSLPRRFRPLIRSLLADLSNIEALPWVLSHGDLIPANIMVCPESGKLLGLLDWAEAEFLPFGVGMYGLEELLGEDVDGAFTYFVEAEHLRYVFWQELLSSIPELARNPKRLDIIKKAQILGIFLWHGIAFDDGALDRACEEGKDDEEIAKLDAFLLPSPGQVRRAVAARRLLTQWPFGFLRNLWIK